ncbi:hypothetical protein GCM10025854_27520 [Tetragenococcus muriaticus]|nr:hypothetical protein GCM10025854_04470 [Tetragenococcus muriaticus]GMA48502.1 hypothetical protein GCM10025854_27520 [Tetragenococcus muriaticus]
MLIQLNKIYKNFSGTPLFENLSLTINEQEKIGLVGAMVQEKQLFFVSLLEEKGLILELSVVKRD